MVQLAIAPADLAELCRVMAEHAPEAEGWVYGSRVRGGCHEGSDIDLVLRNPADLQSPQPRLPALQGALSDSRVAVLVDALDWANIPDSFKWSIEREHVVLQAAPPSGDNR